MLLLLLSGTGVATPPPSPLLFQECVSVTLQPRGALVTTLAAYADIAVGVQAIADIVVTFQKCDE
jgi:hypothetical protein